MEGLIKDGKTDKDFKSLRTQAEISDLLKSFITNTTIKVGRQKSLTIFDYFILLGKIPSEITRNRKTLLTIIIFPETSGLTYVIIITIFLLLDSKKYNFSSIKLIFV